MERFAAQRQRGTVLVVDPEPAIVELVDRMLGGAGYSVVKAGTAEDAVRLLDEIAVDLVIADESTLTPSDVPDRRKLSVAARGIPLLCMTSWTGSARALHFVQKPFYLSELRGKVAQALEEWRRRGRNLSLGA